MTASQYMNILMLIDDDQLAARVRTVTEEAPGVRVVGHHQPDETAIEAVLSLRPDVAVLSWDLPDVRPIELCRGIWQRYPHLGVVALVPRAMDATEVRNFLAEPHDYPGGPLSGDLRHALRDLGDCARYFSVASIEQLLTE